MNIMARWLPGKILWSGLAFLLSLAVGVFIFRDLDVDKLLQILNEADLFWVLLLFVVVPIEQVVRGWKWRQILHDIRPIATVRLFAAVMAGYFANMAMPVGISPLVRAWLVARRESLKLSTVLVTTAIERFVDGVVFAVLVGVFLLFADLPQVDGNLRLGIAVAGAGSFVLFGGLLWVLFRGRKKLDQPDTRTARAVLWLEDRFQAMAGLGEGIVTGITWPKARRRGLGVLAAAVVMKTISASHFLWAGLAVGAVLMPADYLFILIFASFSGILSRFIRLPGGFIIGAAFALGLLGVPDEAALAMVAFVHVASVLTTAAIGAAAFWQSGVRLADLKGAVPERNR